MGYNKGKLGFIMGSNAFNISGLDTLTGKAVDTDCGEAHVRVSDDIVLLSRHGERGNIPPHMINHRANILAFQMLGVKQILSFTSVGSLNLELEPMHILMPDDYINLGRIWTYFDVKIKHIVPGLDLGFREQIYKRIKSLPIKLKFNGIYIQTRGPRLETKAEIQMFKNFGDVVGMTMASEATLAAELGLSYANISIVDNYCNGLTERPLTIQTMKGNQEKNSENVEQIVKNLIPVEK